MTPLAVVVAVLTLVSSLPRSAAEVYHFDNEDVPAPFSFKVKHLFYVWAREKSELHVAEFPVLYANNLRVDGKADGDYTAVQVSTIPWEDFNKLIDPNAVCAGKDSGFINLQKYPSKSWVNSITVPKGKVTAESKKFFQTGVYALVVTNCGFTDNLKISGSVSVKNPFGYLAGKDYYRLPLYGWATLFWAGAAIIWLTLLVAKKEAVVWAHIALALIIIIGFAETVAWWLALTTTNIGGEAPVAMPVAEVLSVMRSICALAFILVLSGGLGVTESELEAGAKTNILIGTMLFGISAVPRLYLSFKPLSIPQNKTVVLLASLPLLLVGAFHFAWILRRLNHSMHRCKQLNQNDSLKIVQRLTIVVCICMLSAAGAVVAQGLDQPGRGLPYWQSHAFWTDGACQGIALIVLLATMCILAPSKSGFLAESYMSHADDKEGAGLTDEPAGKGLYDVDQNDGGKRPHDDVFVVGDDGDPEGGEGGAQPAASTIGAKALSAIDE